MLNSLAGRKSRRRAEQIAHHAKQILGTTDLCVLDVGAADGAPPRWKPFSHLLDYVAVEPDTRSVSALIADASSSFRSRRLITKGLWSTTGEVDLFLCRKPMVSSVYRPNAQFASLFPDPERFQVVGTQRMKVTTVDDVASEGNARFDAIKLDVQGAEYEVLRGATTTLQSTLLVESEVEFLPLYEHQPLAEAVSKELATHDLEFVDYLFLYRWHPNHLDGTGQLVFADALFMRTPETLSPTDDLAQRRYAVLALMYGRGDMLTRLSRIIQDQPLAAMVLSIANDTSLLTSRVNSRLQTAARFLRMTDPNARAHLFY